MTRGEELYRLSYYTGIQMIRLFHRMGRFFTLIFLPLRLFFRRVRRSLNRKKSYRVREGFAGLRRRFGKISELVRAAWNRHPLLGILQVLYLPIHAIKHYRGASKAFVHVAAGLAALTLLSATLYYWSDTTFALALTDDSGEVWAYVADERTYQKAVSLAKERLGEAAEEVSFSGTSAEMSLQIIPQASVWTENEVCDYLMEQIDLETRDACGVYIDGVLCATVDSRRNGQDVLDEILEENRGENEDVETSFVEKVELVEGVYLEEGVLDHDDLKEMLTATETDEKTHTVRAGDTVSSIAAKYGISVEKLKKLNPQMGTKLDVGQVLYIQKRETYLRVQVSGTVQYEVEVMHTVVLIPDATLYEGEEKVRVEGKNGIDLVTATVTYLNGVEQFSVITETERLKDPVEEIRVYGTKRRPGSGYVGGEHANGYFVWPVPHTNFLSQQYGEDGHRGIDIWANDIDGKPILAADGGRVIMAGEYAGYKTYGKFVIIDHGNGYTTVYAHCSKVLVKEGDIVNQGQEIAKVGNTGRSTGPHLHFEVQKNGVLMNPMKFFK